jgi:hypothetical protein
VHDAAALDHEPLHAAVGEVLAEPAHPHAPAAVHDRRHRPEPRAGVGHPRARGVDELLVSPVVKKFERASRSTRSVTVIFIGDGASPRPCAVAAGLRAHEQPRVVGAHGDRADHDRVARGAHLVDPVEVGLVGQREARRLVAEVAVERHAAAQQGVRAVSIALPRRPGRRPTATRRGARQAGDEHHHAVDDRGGDPERPRPGRRGERPRRHALARPPAADVGQRARRITSSARAAATRRVHPRRPRGDQERDRVARDDQRRRERDAGQPAREQPVAQVAAAARRSRAHATAEAGPGAARATPARRRPPPRGARAHERHGRAHGRRAHEAARRRSGRPAPPARPSAPTRRRAARADVARAAAVADARWTSPTTPPGSVTLRKRER